MINKSNRQITMQPEFSRLRRFFIPPVRQPKYKAFKNRQNFGCLVDSVNPAE